MYFGWAANTWFIKKSMIGPPLSASSSALASGSSEFPTDNWIMRRPAAQPSVRRRIFVTVPVVEAMHRDVVSVAPELSVKEAAEILLQNKYGCLPVVDDSGLLVGIVTEADFLRLTVQLLK